MAVGKAGAAETAIGQAPIGARRRNPGRAVGRVPSPSPGWDLAVTGSEPDLASAGEPGGGRSCSVGSWSSAFREANLAPSVDPGPVLRDPCAEALKDREPEPCFGVSASSEEAWNPGSESRTGSLDFRVSPDFRAAVSLRPVDVPTKSGMRQAPPFRRLCGSFPDAVGNSVDICGRTQFAEADQGLAPSTGKACFARRDAIRPVERMAVQDFSGRG